MRDNTEPQSPCRDGARDFLQLYFELTGIDLTRCPRCTEGIMRSHPLPTPAAQRAPP